jgi:hypothetical protein
MFGINDNKTTGQDPVMPQPLESTDPVEDLAAGQDDPTTPPLASSPAAISPDDPAVLGDHAQELLKIKQQALNNLAPLVGKLDQTPEEKFKTTMMMLQASDNPDLVKDAYAAANKITDEKIRAQALLDVVNEINYFTHHDAA